MNLFKLANKRLILGALLAACILFAQSAVLAITSGSKINVGFTVPQVENPPGPPPGPGPGGDNPPSIANVVVTSTYTTAQITWTATDDVGIIATGFVYGLTNTYGSSGVVAGAYQVSLSGLATNTLYYFKISVTDTGAQTTNYTGSWQTSQFIPRPVGDITPPVISNVQLSTGVTTTSISWQTDETAVGQVLYGLTNGYGQSVNLNDFLLNQSTVLSSLTADTVYHFQIIATDAFGNSAGTSDQTFTTKSVTPPSPPVVSEICNNGVDDDSNSLTDCADPACVGFAGCVGELEPVVTGTLEVFNPPEGSGGRTSNLAAENLIFLANNRHTPVAVKVGGMVSSLAGSGFTIGVPTRYLYEAPRRLLLAIEGIGEYQFNKVVVGEVYYLDFNFPRLGNYRAYLEVDYSGDERDVVNLVLNSHPFGNISDGTNFVAGASVSLLAENGSLVDVGPSATLGGAANPEITDINGMYGWVAPNGRYRLKVRKEGFYDRETPVFSVENNVINLPVNLIIKPGKLFKDVDSEKTLAKNVATVAKNLAGITKPVGKLTAQRVGDLVNQAAELKNNPEVQRVVGSKVAPVAVAVTAAATLAFISWADLLPFLRLLFLQPLMLLGLKRRQGWGQVYNSLNKLPLDLVTVRLINAETNKLAQTKVTDIKGRYAFVAEAGEYKIEASKGSFTFPSALLTNYQTDGRRADLYHGEIIKVAEKDAVITANIPLDPVGETKIPLRLFWQNFGRGLQIILSWSGLAVTAVSLYISPHWYVWALLGAHLLLFVIFRRLAVPPKIKSWGIVYDAASNLPVPRAFARLFNSQFNKLVSTQVTDNKGRYYFLAGDNQYYVTYDHHQYIPHKTEVIDLSGKEADNITVDVGLKKLSSP